MPESPLNHNQLSNRTWSTRKMRVPPKLKLSGTQLAGWEPKQHAQPKASGIIFDENIRIPMLDGVELVADLFRPAGLGPTPVLLSWAIYIKDTERLGGGPFIDESGVCTFTIQSGYAVLRVQPRGTGQSGGIAGEEMQSQQEIMDCHTTIEWAAAQSFCDGSVGMTGMSYFAIAQLMVAPTRPPSLKAIFPYKAMTDVYRHGFYKGGAAFSGIIELFAAFEKMTPPKIPSWIRHLLSYALNNPRFAMEMSDPAKTQRTIRGFLKSHPPSKEAVAGYVNRMFDRVFDDNDYWRRASAGPNLAKINIPVCIATDFGAQDLHLFGAFEAWHKLTCPKFLFIGPPEYRFPWSNYQKELVAWYDWTLKNIDNGYADLPPVRFWLRGAEQWHSATNWPLPDAQPYILNIANTDPAEKSSLTLQLGESAESQKSYLAIPSTSFTLAEIDRYETQILTCATEPFAVATDLIGPVTLHLNFTATAIDTYFVVRLSDIAPNGQRQKLSWGWLLASHRTIDTERSNPTEIVHNHASQAAVQLRPGEKTHVAFSLNPIANRFRP